MNRQKYFLPYIFVLILLVFTIGRACFIGYNHALAHISVWDALQACRVGLLSHDLTVALVMLLVPALAWLAALCWPRFPLRLVLLPYFVLLGVVVAAVVVADAVMYEFWQFKLHAVVLSYAASPEGATSSVSPFFILARVSAVVGLCVMLAAGCIRLTPKRMSVPDKRLGLKGFLLVLALNALAIPFTHVGSAYYSPTLFLNHAATNPVYAFFSSFAWNKPYGQRFHYLSAEASDSTFARLYPSSTEDVTDTLLRVRRPHILLVSLESFGGKFVRELGGLPEVSPQLGRLIPEGIFWEQYYSNSFRTDRGTASTLTGHVAHPDVSLQRDTVLHPLLASLPCTLAHEGYHTSYLYAGPMTNMGKRRFLEDLSFQRLLDDRDFRPEEIATAWGADDEVSCRKLCELVAQMDSVQPSFLACQTISSHEPWVVPYHRLSDEKLNAFAYTDHCIGQLVDSLKQLPQWDNLLVIIIPDHGFLYQQSYQDPEFFHSPMLWLGGAIAGPRRMSVLINQSDLAATLLSQLGISHADFRWSRNVLSRRYTHPFVYCNFPAGIMWKDATGVSIYDIVADRPILERQPDGGERIRRAQAVLQASYAELEN